MRYKYRGNVTLHIKGWEEDTHRTVRNMGMRGQINSVKLLTLLGLHEL
jgi:hypothetical protein